MIKAVIFDVDGVLIDSLEANFKFFSDLMNNFGYDFMKPEEFTSLFHLPMKDIIRHVTKTNNEEEIEKIWLAGVERVVPYPNELIKTPGDLQKVIEILSKKYVLAVATSRSRAGIYSIPQLNNLKGYFKITISYEDTKNHKPHPAPLLLASEKLGIIPSLCLYVGDSKTDAIAAKAAGMKAIIYSKNISPEADANISDFSKLTETISKL